MNKPHIAIIGGGCAGLSAATTLVDHGFSVTLFEASSELGGRTRSVEIKNNTGIHLLDNGQHILIGAYKATLALLSKIGLNEKNIFLRLPLQIIMRDHNKKIIFSLKSTSYLPAPFDMLFALLGCKGLSLFERIVAIKLMVKVKMSRYRVNDDCPLEYFLIKHQQTKGLITMLWEPLCLAALNTPIAIASTQIFLNALNDSLSRKGNSQGKKNNDFLLPKLDLSKIIAEPISKYIMNKGAEIKLNHRIKSLTFANDSFILKTQNEQSFFSHVIIATQPANLDKLIQSCTALNLLATQIRSYSYQPIYTVYLKYPDTTKLPNVMTGLTNTLAQWAFDKGQLSQQHGLIAVVISGSGHHQSLTHDELALQVAEELNQTFPDMPTPLWHKVIAEKRATFSCTPNLARAKNKTFQKNLYLAGDYTYANYPATIEGAIRSGIDCANLIADRYN
jgi:squalene-associated FAD-dependent desaturase